MTHHERLELRRLETCDTKACMFCKQIKPLNDFYKCAGERKGRAWRCKQCHTEYFKSRKDRTRDLRRHNKYGVSPDAYSALLTFQDSGCGICGAVISGHPSSDELLIDHDHNTNTVRGLLCASCNVGIGHFRDNPMLLLSAFGYLTMPPAGEVLR